MQRTLEQLKSFLSSNRIIIILLSIAVFSILLLFVGISNGRENDSNSTKGRSTDVNTSAQNLKSINLPEAELSAIKESIQKVAQKNGTTDIDYDKVVIRKKTIKNKFFEDFNLSYINFIIDIPDKKQSYQISHEWSEDQENEYLTKKFSTQAFCISDTAKIKYKNFDCKDSYSQDPKYLTVKNYARFNYSSDMEIIPSEVDPTHLFVATYSYNEADRQKIIDRAVKWIESLGFSAEGFIIEAGEAGGGAPEE